MVDFNKKIDRSKNDSRKWAGRKKYFGREDLLPMWVADMDIEAPDVVVEALKNKADQKIFGYTMENERYIGSLVNWVKKRHGSKLSFERIAHSPTVVTSLNLLIKILTNEGDQIMIQSPTYPQFVKQIESNGRKVVINELVEKENGYEMDFIDFEEKVKNSVVFILCNPHNPAGRVWTREESSKIAEICVKYGVKIISDEIHSDLILDGKHISIASLGREVENLVYTCLSATKTFNLAGIQSSFVVFPTRKEKENFVEELSLIGVHEPNSFCMDMVISAYNHGEEWLEKLLDHLRGNIEFAVDYIEKNIPQIRVKKPEATYLLWLDLRKFGLDDEKLKERLVEDGGLALTMGGGFMGSGFARMNIACPRYMLEDGLERLKKAFG
ncbi:MULTISPECIES: MalY/PatB family protein [Psychrilyobacter]|uniref:cysteine-S-conjugate beta-lyase n=1 Tax=Psychrilyobacter piezotolerans TaxID=2293438 RepID=A0ABX9KJM3_9FUSO|nr:MULTISPECIES: MalY/PatB family protein [Psychrilyobacter]MCS5421084.1 pyridoxal phosphate-dependent aminotransferase [Psychrilyobacter sp. S5]NDI76777.1 pyridoxal phosphate-dependent aminotransferase [Psychrilyobacter piezotolerans]RDE65061.1 pyridoxal phosphate-dependent aminotransferase [Psychrilyobacter sp. S5]REI42631.1 putative C-S lyase [Psychrilyobacter piezotolerans]